MSNKSIIRITALWACSEAFLGGMLFALKIPFSGIILASFASICISVIAVLSPKRGAITKAVLVVIAVKFALSPHSPIMAYLAVFIQGIVGELLFLNRKKPEFSAFVLSLFALCYSAIQRLLVLWILFGKNFYVALNDFLDKITANMVSDRMADYFIVGYFSLYFFAGILAGIINIRIIRNIKSGVLPDYVSKAKELLQLNSVTNYEKPKKRRFGKWLAALSILIFTASYLPIVDQQIANNQFVYIVLRFTLIVIFWIFVVTPLLQAAVKWVIENKLKPGEIKSVLELLPEMRSIIQSSWLATSTKNRWQHIKQFLNTCFLLTLSDE